MTFQNPLRFGAVLAATVGVGYALCTLVFWVFPEASANFMNALFHGLDFKTLKTAAGFTLGSFLWGLVVLVAWAFAMGTLFEWFALRFGPRA